MGTELYFKGEPTKLHHYNRVSIHVKSVGDNAATVDVNMPATCGKGVEFSMDDNTLSGAPTT